MLSPSNQRNQGHSLNELAHSARKQHSTKPRFRLWVFADAALFTSLASTLWLLLNIRSRRASVSVMTAVSIMVLLGMADLGTEYGYGLVLLIRSQRIADSAAFAGALSYATLNTTAGMQQAASAVAALNGGATVTTSLVASPRNDGNSAVMASVTLPYTILLSKQTLTPTGVAYVELAGSAPPCIIALNKSGAGISLFGGTRVSTSGCAVASNASVTVPCGTFLYTDTIDWDSSAPTTGCLGILPTTKSSTSIRQVLTADPLASNTVVTSAAARLSAVATISAPSAPTVSGNGTNLTFDFRQSTSMSTGNACTATHAAYNGAWTVTCPSNGTYTFGALTLSGGTSVNFDSTGTGSIYNIFGSVTNNGSTLTFGSGTFNLAAGLITGGGTNTTFGSGTVNIGRSNTPCTGDGAYYSICNVATLSFAGPTIIQLQAGLYNGGGSTLSIGSNSTLNSYRLGPSSNGYAMYMGGGSTTTLGDAANGLFQAVGGISASGGACINLPATSQHDIYGRINTAGGLTLGAGVYTITGYVDVGGSGGGDWYCNQQFVGVYAVNTTLVIGAAQTPADACSGQALCVAAGFSHVTITAPTSGTDANLAVIGPTNGMTAGASFIEGATSTVLSGAFYFPDAALSLAGAASISSGGQCLELIASQIVLTGGAAAAAICPGLNTTSSTTPLLVQ